MNEHERRWTVVFIGVFLHAITGCGTEDLGQVNGFVKVGGKPLNTGSILFQNTIGSVSINADITEDGAFIIRTFDKNGIPPGDYRVAVRPESFGGSGDASLVGQPTKSRPRGVVPEKYHDIRTSGVEVTVKRGANPPYVFNLLP